jgi:exopolysaccharide biosynthesis polyprenyl glycosylphosphotransferase
MVVLLIRVDVPEEYLGVTLPVGTVALVLSRRMWRTYLARKRARGSHCNAVLVIGRRDALLTMATELSRNPREGYRVVGFGVPGHTPPAGEHLIVNGDAVPIVSVAVSVPAATLTCGADTVAIAEAGDLGVQGIQRLIWDLEPMGVHLVLSPCLLDVAPSRLTMRTAAGLPLLHVGKPRYHAAEGIAKLAFDYCFAVIALAATLPILALAALAIKIDSKGPVFYRSERIGLDGRPFAMFKLRTMVQDADQQLDVLLALNDYEGLLFKMRDDPRITAVGRFLRRFSIDELPQFLNVLRHEMSVVGPRPPLRREVDAYDRDLRRRLLVRPGITGPWQISGRCDLAWDRAVRLDLAYVDNWSMGADLVIIAKTIRAVFGHEGAY